MNVMVIISAFMSIIFFAYSQGTPTQPIDDGFKEVLGRVSELPPEMNNAGFTLKARNVSSKEMAKMRDEAALIMEKYEAGEL